MPCLQWVFGILRPFPSDSAYPSIVPKVMNNREQFVAIIRMAIIDQMQKDLRYDCSSLCMGQLCHNTTYLPAVLSSFQIIWHGPKTFPSFICVSSVFIFHAAICPRSHERVLQNVSLPGWLCALCSCECERWLTVWNPSYDVGKCAGVVCP